MVVCEKCKDEIIEQVMPEEKEWAITCSDCKQPATVPFKPRDGWSVYCRDCFHKRNPK